ncbi:MAG: Crp/Fnr family transcriptional regulator [Armatimonadota bacterium]
MPSPLALSEVSIFQGLSPEELKALAALLQRRLYRKGETVFRQSDPGSTLYIIESGEVKVTLVSSHGKEVILAILGQGGFFGELALLDGESRSADAVTRVDSRLLALHREPFLEFLRSHPSTAIRVIEALSRRVRRTTGLVQEAAFLDVPQRLARVLLQIHEPGRQLGPDGIPQYPRLTQRELAELVGTTRETINKCLGDYEKQGLIRRSKGLVRVLKPEELMKRIY